MYVTQRFRLEHQGQFKKEAGGERTASLDQLISYLLYLCLQVITILKRLNVPHRSEEVHFVFYSSQM